MPAVSRGRQSNSRRSRPGGSSSSSSSSSGGGGRDTQQSTTCYYNMRRTPHLMRTGRSSASVIGGGGGGTGAVGAAPRGVDGIITSSIETMAMRLVMGVIATRPMMMVVVDITKTTFVFERVSAGRPNSPIPARQTMRSFVGCPWLVGFGLQSSATQYIW